MEHKIFYRYVDEEQLHGIKIVEQKYVAIKETTKGFWIVRDYIANHYRDSESLMKTKKWVPKDSIRRFAYPTREEAKKNFIARKNRQIKLNQYYLDRAKTALQKIENMGEK